MIVLFRAVAATLIATLLFGLVNVSFAADALLQKGSRIVFLGDSITQGGAGPGGYVTLVREALSKSHHDLGLEVIGAGISGNKVPDLEKRLDKDVLAKNPTVVVIYIGINDVWHSQSGKGTSKEDYEAGLKRIIDKINAANSKVILCTASVIGEKTDGSNPLDKMLDEYCEISRKVAAEKKTGLLDLRKAFMEHLKAHNKDNKDRGILTGDIVHLNAGGNKFVAEQMLTALGASSGGNKVLRHVVLFKFKDDATPAQVQEIVDAFGQLPKKIDAIIDYEHGTENSPEMLAQGFTHVFVVTFKDEKGREAYLPHQAHQDFVTLLKPKLDKVLVVDFWSQK